MESLLPEVAIFDARTTPRLAFVGRVLPGLRFGASKRLILGARSQVGLRTAFGWEPVGLGGGSSFGGPTALISAPKEEGIGRLRGPGTAGGAGRIGAGEDGAENRDDGESWFWLVTSRVGVAGYDRLSNSK
jgi:hypothetical protein